MQLKVKASSDKLIVDIQALQRGTYRCIGRRWNTVARWFEPSNAEDVPALPEYLRAVQCGDLLAADEATALYCGTSFNK